MSRGNQRVRARLALFAGIRRVQTYSKRELVATIVGFALVISGLTQIQSVSNSAETPLLCDSPMIISYTVPANTAIRLTVSAAVSAPGVSIRWGDGTDEINNLVLPVGTLPPAHTYTSAGTYDVSICGNFTTFGTFINSATDPIAISNSFITEVKDWGLPNSGVNSLNSISYAFRYASQLTAVPNTLPSGVTNLNGTFMNATAFNGSGVSSWNTSAVTQMSRVFAYASAFNQPLGTWNTSNVTLMSEFFNGAAAFNQNISTWDTSKVTSFEFMFTGATAFNQPIGSWNTANVTNMSWMFYRASNFNQPINTWNTEKVTNMSLMFYGATKFNQPLSTWKTGNVTNMSGMFNNAAIFNQDLNTDSANGYWNTGKVTDMSNMFRDAKLFNGDISGWDTSKVVNMGSMFTQASAFNSDLSSWNVSSVTSMATMFQSALVFNSDLSRWVTSNVTNMSQMFQSAQKFRADLSLWNTSKVTNMAALFADNQFFNSDLSRWDVSKVTTMSNMFRDTTAFNGSLAGWNTTSVTTMDSMFLRASAFNQSVGHFDISKIVPTTGMKTMFNSSGISDANYGQTLIDWNAQPSKPTGVVLDAVAKIAPCGAARSAWTALKSAPTSWTITDGTAASAACPVAPTSVTVTAANTSKNYGEANPNVGFSVSAGYESAAWLSSVTCSSKLTNSGSAVVESTPVGNYVNVCSGPDGSADNLAITYTNGALEIEKRPVSIRIKDRSASAGTTFSLPSALTSNLAETEYYSITSGSLFESESLTIVFSTTSSNPLVAGTYSLGATLQSNAVTENYEVTFVPGTLSVNAVASRPTPPQSPVVVPNVNMIMPASAPLASLTSARIFGIHLGDVTQIKVGPKRAKLYRVGDTSIDFRIPKLLPGNYAIELTHKDGRVHSWDSRITITGTIPKKPLTREFPGFGLASHVLTDSLESKLRKFFRSNRVKYSTIRCVGMTDGPFIPEIDGPLAVKRANVACEMAKSFGFRVVGRSSINGTSYNPMDRKAILTLGN